MIWDPMLAEEAVLGGLMLLSGTGQQAPDLHGLTPDDMSTNRHRILFGSILGLLAEGKPHDEIAVLHRLAEDRVLHLIRNQGWVLGLVWNTPGTANIEHWCRVIRAEATARRMAAEIAEAGGRVGRGNAAPVVSAELVGTLTDLASEQETRRVTMREAMQRMLPDLEARRLAPPGIRTGFGDLDAMLGGLKPAQLVIVAGRPGMGKTALASQIAMNAAETARVIVVSLEMSASECLDRMLAQRSGVDMSRIGSGRLFERDFPKLAPAMQHLQKLPIEIIDPPSVRVDDLALRVRGQGVGLVVVDYLQLVTADGSSRVDEVERVSRGLKQMAMTLRCPVIALSQLSRENEKRPGKIPQLSDLRSSGSIEQDADAVMFVHREGYYDAQKNQREAICLVAKNRNGPTGVAPLTWDGPCVRFGNVAQR